MHRLIGGGSWRALTRGRGTFDCSGWHFVWHSAWPTFSGSETTNRDILTPLYLGKATRPPVFGNLVNINQNCFWITGKWKRRYRKLSYNENRLFVPSMGERMGNRQPTVKNNQRWPNFADIARSRFRFRYSTALGLSGQLNQKTRQSLRLWGRPLIDFVISPKQAQTCDISLSSRPLEAWSLTLIPRKRRR